MDTKSKDILEENCPIMSVFSQLSKMWVLAILLQISHGQKYFSSIKNSLHGISSRTLSVRLKELQKYDFIVREIVSEQPLKIEYSLTQKGKSFSKELQHLSKWAEKWG